MINKERIKVKEDEYLIYGQNKNVDELIKLLQKAKTRLTKLNFTNIELIYYPYDEWSSHDSGYYIQYDRDENDDEYAKRINKETEIEDMRTKRELEEYKKLKEKFGDNV